MAPASQRPVEPGRPYPLGATWSGRGVNFALFSEHAERVDLCLFDSTGKKEERRIRLPEVTDHIWHGFIPDLAPGQLYGYRVYGPYDPLNGHRFNDNKLLVDPYAKGLAGTVQWHPACYGYKIGHSKGDLSFDKRDSARYVPKSQVVSTDFPWNGDTQLERPLNQTVIYEAHVKGMTARHPDVPAPLRGTFQGLAHTSVIEHLTNLGITAIELMPVQSFLDETHLQEKGLTNYWGYNPISFFAPERRYLAGPHPNEFKSMVARLHEASIEVILDVVYNHTCEGNHFGPTISLRGIDNKSYYHLVAETPRYYHNHSGCGNTLNLTHPRVLQMVMDSLRYWVDEMHVDGYRFDLAAAVARGTRGFEPNSIFLAAVRQDPTMQKVKLIAEPWDIGPSGYRTGEFPAGWSEWNDAYRDNVRAFWRGDPGTMGGLATRLAGSSDIFWRRTPLASVNFVTAHDGFTLNDLVSYNGKHNDANQEENQDGTNHNLSWNCGHEGPTDDAAIKALRYRQKRNLIATLMLSQGIPMLLAGDELSRTQNGNNNAYCLDSRVSWLDWASEHDDDHKAFLAFVCEIIRLRQTHPAFRRRTFFTGQPRTSTSRIKDITWLSPSGAELTDAEWTHPEKHSFGMHLDGDDSKKTDGKLIVLINASMQDIDFKLPSEEFGLHWSVVIDTAHEEDDEPSRPIMADETILLTDHSLVVLKEWTGKRHTDRRLGDR